MILLANKLARMIRTNISFTITPSTRMKIAARLGTLWRTNGSTSVLLRIQLNTDNGK